MRRRLSYFEKRLLLREESFIRKRDFYEEKVFLEKEHDFNFDFCLLENIEKNEKNALPQRPALFFFDASPSNKWFLYLVVFQ